jgi:hypothetical protein
MAKAALLGMTEAVKVALMRVDHPCWRYDCTALAKVANRRKLEGHDQEISSSLPHMFLDDLSYKSPARRKHPVT